MQEILMSWALHFLQSYPAFASVFAVLGVIRIVMKPLMTLVHVIVDITPYDSDNKWLADAETSNAYKALAYLLDWAVSIKAPEKSSDEKKD